MRTRSLSFAASLALLGGAPLAAATIVERHVVIEVRGDGVVEERERWTVEIDRPEEVGEWSPFAVPLDENRRLVRLSASVVDPAGRSRKVPDREIDTTGHTGSFELHSSRRLVRVTFPGLTAGGRMLLDWEVEEKPWFPTGVIGLGTTAAVENLRVELRGPASLRWTVVGRPELVRETPIAGGVVFTSENLGSRATPELGLDPEVAGPTILFSWAEDGSWEALGGWFRDLSFPLLRADERVSALAQGLTGTTSDGRETLESLLRFVRREVRYVAVEVGIGGYRPSSPEETLARRWGDCKDKSFLLIALLRSRGIAAHPVLIRAGDPMPPDPAFPSPAWFDHLIVAVPVDGLEVGPEDPVAEDLLFLDPTQIEGSALWLHPAVQGRPSLLVTETGSRLVTTPVRPSGDGSRLLLELVVHADDRATGRVTRIASGQRGATLRARLVGLRDERVADELKTMLERLLPGATVSRPEWSLTELPVPEVVIRAEVAIDRFLQRSGSGAVLDLPDEPRLPPPRVFDARPEAWALDPELHTREWRLDLSATGCRAEPVEVVESASPGTYAASVSMESAELVVRRRTEVSAAWIEPAGGEALRRAALLEHQTAKRRLRLVCDAGQGA